MTTAHATTHSKTVALDVARVRRDFPILQQKVHGHPLVYLDNAATSQKPQAVLDAIQHYYETTNANVHRGVHFLSQRATDLYETARARVRRYLNASDDAEIIYVRGATEAINLVACSWGDANVGPGDEIIISAMEHHSNIVPWQMLCARRGAHLRIAPINDRGELLMDEFRALISPRTKLVAMVWISNALGTINPMHEIIALAHEHSIPVLVDACQAVQHMSVDVRALDSDFLVFSGHKTYAPTGIGILHGKRALLEAMPPWQGGGDMIRTVSFEKTTYNDLPFRFEAGTPHIEGAIGLGAALEYIDALGHNAIAAHEHDLLDYGTRLLEEIPGLRLIGTARQKTSVLSFVIDGIHATDLGALIDHEGIAVRVGHHCAMPVMDFFCVPGTVRASLALYNTREDLDRLADALRKAVALGRGAKERAQIASAPAPAESIDETQERIIAEFSQFTRWEDRYERIIEEGERLPDIPAEYKTDKHIVKGCQSIVHMHAWLEDGRVRYVATSDASIVRGLIALLLRVYSNRTPDDIIRTPPDFIQRLGLNENLTQGRANGLAAMIEQMKLYALVLKTTAKAKG